MSDEMLNHYGDLFVKLYVRLAFGITFEQFLMRPESYLVTLS